MDKSLIPTLILITIDFYGPNLPNEWRVIERPTTASSRVELKINGTIRWIAIRLTQFVDKFFDLSIDIIDELWRRYSNLWLQLNV